ncbi:MAG: hypothetical protein ACI8PZ_004332 [Myxococcota bacterium]|jgi:hypothetical protein
MDIPIPESWDEASTMLIPAIRRATEPGHAFQAERADPANRLLRRLFAPCLSELVMLDLPDVRMFVNQGHLERWGVSGEDAFVAAHEVLKDHAAAGLSFNDTYGVWQLDAPDGASTSRLLLDGWLSAFADQVEGRPIAIAPWRRLLMIGGLDDDEQLGRLLDIAEQGWRRAPSPTTPAVYTVDDDGKTVPLHTSPITLRHRRVEAGHRTLAHRVYADQREMLLPYAPVPLAPLHLEHSSDTGEALTWTEWTEASPEVWLPEADHVRVHSEAGEAWLPWDVFRALAAGALTRLDLHPMRYRTQWPTLKAVYAMVAASEPRD